MIQSFKDEYKVTNKERSTPAELGSILVKSEERKRVNAKRYTYYRSGLGKLLHVERRPRPHIQNAVRELSKQGIAPNETHIKAIHGVMEYVISTTKEARNYSPTGLGTERTKTLSLLSKSKLIPIMQNILILEEVVVVMLHFL